MCIAIYKPADNVIDRDTLERCFDANPDGCGFAYTSDDGISIHVSMEFEEFYQQYLEATQEAPESPFLIHFRIATHGVIALENCHPFYIEDDSGVEKAFIHNGTIKGMVPQCKIGVGPSDTRLFGEQVLNTLPLGWEDSSGMRAILEDYIGWSRLIVMDEFGHVTLYNEHKGIWDDGVWYSNDSYKPRVVYQYDWRTHSQVFEECDMCGRWTDTCRDFINEGFLYMVCPKCRGELIQAQIYPDRYPLTKVG